MSTGYNNKFDEENGTIHCTHYDDYGRHSMDYDPLTGDTTKDHSVSNGNQDDKKQWDESNIWDELAKDDKEVEKYNGVTDSDDTDFSYY